MMSKNTMALLTIVAVLAGCVAEGPAGDTVQTEVPTQDTAVRVAAAPRMATALGDGATMLPAHELEAGRLDRGWRRYIDRPDRGRDERDPPPADTSSEAWSDISTESVNGGPVQLPLGGDVEGPSVLAVQTLLDRAHFSPGVLDGRWGNNTEKAVYWLQEREGLPATGTVDTATFARLSTLAGTPGQMVVVHRLTAEDVEGPFRPVPEDVYEQAELDCLCYESLREKLGELFHSTPELLEQLNPGVTLDALRAGDALHVPAVREEIPLHGELPAAGESDDVPDTVERILVSDGGHYVHALDAEGRLLYHFPSTLGSEYAPSPEGDYTVDGIAWQPTWHYQPELLTGVPESREDAVLPAGPNNAVGVVWLELSKPHYGIHGTSAPETIGYVTSHGCVRLTNWDAAFLAKRVAPGTRVEFRDPDARTAN